MTTAVAIQERIVSAPSTWLELAVVDMAKALAPNTYLMSTTIIAIGFKDSGDDSVERVEVEDSEGKSHYEIRVEFNRKTLEKIVAGGLIMPKRVIPFLCNSYAYANTEGVFSATGRQWCSLRDHVAAWMAWAACAETGNEVMWICEDTRYHWPWLQHRNRMVDALYQHDAKDIMSNAYKNPPVSSEFLDLFA